MERHLAAGGRHTMLVPRDDQAPGVQMYYSLPCGLDSQVAHRLMRRELSGVALETFGRLTRARLISAECHRLVAAMVISMCMMSRQAHVLIGDHLYIIGEPGGQVAKGWAQRRRPAAVKVTSTMAVERAGDPPRFEPGLGGCENECTAFLTNIGCTANGSTSVPKIRSKSCAQLCGLSMSWRGCGA